MWGIYKLVSAIFSLIKFLFSFLKKFFKSTASKKDSISHSDFVSEFKYKDSQKKESYKIEDDQKQNNRLVIEPNKAELQILNLSINWNNAFHESLDAPIQNCTLNFEYDPFGIKKLLEYYRLIDIKKEYSSSLSEQSLWLEAEVSISDEMLHELNFSKLTEFLKQEVFGMLCMNLNANPLSIQFSSANEFVCNDDEVNVELDCLDAVSPIIATSSFAEREMYRREHVNDENGK